MKSAAMSRFALHPDAAAHQFHQAGGYGQPQASAAVLPRSGAVGLRERLKDHAMLFRRNADAGVDDAKTQRDLRSLERFGAVRSQRPVPALVNLMALPARLRRTWLMRSGSPIKRSGTWSSITDSKANPLSRGTQRQGPQHVPHQCSQRELHAIQSQLADFVLREVQNIVDQAQERLGRRLHQLQIFPLIALELGLERQTSHPENAV